MFEPYRMVFINVLLFLSLLAGIGIYRHLFPKRKFNLLLLLCLISLLPIISIFRAGVYESGDFTIHAYRAIEFYHVLSEGNIIPSWAEHLNATYGYGAFLFLHPLPYYLQALFHFLGASFTDSLKLVLATSYLSSGIFFYLWAKRETKHSFAAFSGAIVYLFTPYHLVDLHFRVALGETVFFAFLPLFFYLFSLYKEKQTVVRFLLTALCYAALFFSHQAMALLSSLIIIPYIIASAYHSKHFLKQVSISTCMILLGFIFAASSWISHVVYPPYTYISLLSQQTIIFPHITELLYSPWRYGLLFQGPQGELSYLVGYTQLGLIALSLFLIITKRVSKTTRSPLLFWLSITLFLLFMMTPTSANIWRSLPILNTAQFSTRLLLLMTFSLASLMVYMVITMKNRTNWIIAFLAITVGLTLLNWGHRTVIPSINDHALIANLPKSTYEGEGLTLMGSPKWIDIQDPWKMNSPKQHLEVITGEGIIREITRTSTHHTYVVFVEKAATLQENTYFFPGWEVQSNEKQISHTFTKGEDPGLISFSLKPGLYKIDVIYSDIFPRTIAKLITSVTVSFAVVLIIIFSARKYFKKK